MNKISRILFDSIQVALWGKEADIALYQGLTVEDWNELYDAACKQTVEALVFDALETIDPDELSIPKPLIRKWCIRIQQIEERNGFMNGIMAEQLACFAKENIIPVLQKGQGIAQYYPNPLHRNCGDIDWYFDSRDSFDKVYNLVKDQVSELSFSSLDGFFRWKGLETELHLRLVESRNPLNWKFIKSLEQKYQNQFQMFQVGAEIAKTPAPILNLLLVNIHILKHQITYGIGMRQFCDAAVLYDKLDGLYDKMELYRAYKKLGVVAWSHVFHHFLVTYMGLDESKLPYAIKKGTDSKWMAEDLIRGANFGFHDESHPDHLVKGRRINRASRLSSTFVKYVKIAPSETLVFPVFQSMKRIYMYFKRSKK